MTSTVKSNSQHKDHQNFLNGPFAKELSFGDPMLSLCCTDNDSTNRASDGCAWNISTDVIGCTIEQHNEPILMKQRLQSNQKTVQVQA